MNRLDTNQIAFDIIEQINIKRLERHLKLSTLARTLKVPPNSLGELLTYKVKRPSFNFIIYLANYFNISVDNFIKINKKKIDKKLTSKVRKIRFPG